MLSAHNVLPVGGYVRLAQLLGPRGPVPISRSTLFVYVRDGRFPAPVKLGPRITAWRVEDINAWMAARE